MGCRLVVIINYVKYSATYDIIPVGLLWRSMSYITKNIVLVFCNCKVYLKFHVDLVIEKTHQNPFTDGIAVFFFLLMVGTYTLNRSYKWPPYIFNASSESKHQTYKIHNSVNQPLLCRDSAS